ncbi:MAG: tape measure protein [Gammaproteobacteria bacterium]|nr:tape measure protein [Gammaproteobacteria bacterium]
MARDRIELILDAKNRTNKAFESANKNITKLERSVKNIQRLGNVFTSLFAVNQIAGYAQDLSKIADEWRNIEGRLKLVTKNSTELKQVQDDLFNVSQKTSSSYQETANLYAQVARNSEALGVSNKDLLSLTEVINQSIQVSGASSQASEAAITQLNQALGSGVLRGDEFNSIMEQAPRLAEAMADGLGVPIGALRDLAQEGELTAERVIKSLLDQKKVIEEEYATLPETMARSITKLNNEWGRFVSEVDKSTGATDKAAQNVNALSSAFNAVTNQVDRFSNIISTTSELSDHITDLMLKAVPGADAIKAYLTFEEAQTKSLEATKKAAEATNELKETTDELTESEFALQYAQEKENEILAEKQGEVDKVLDKLQEESKLLKMTAKEQFIYNQVKKAGTDLSFEQTEAIKEAAESLFDEKEAIKANKKEIKELTKATESYKKETSQGQSSSIFGKEKENAEELTKATEEATKKKKEWFSATSQPGKDTSDAFDPVNLTPEQAARKATEIKAAMQQVFDTDPVQVKVNTPNPKQITNNPTSTSSFSDPLKGGGSGLSAVSVSRQALKQGNKQ